jgi:hypothetical protein
MVQQACRAITALLLSSRVISFDNPAARPPLDREVSGLAQPN